MGKIVVSENVTLDGVIQDPAGAEGFSARRMGRPGRRQGSRRGGQAAARRALGAEALLLGRRTYEFFAERWPSRSGELADRLNSMPKYVVSSTLKDPGWNNSTVLRGDVVNEVSKLKQELDGEIVVAGQHPARAHADGARPRRRAAADGLPGRARGRRAPVRRDERQEANASRRQRGPSTMISSYLIYEVVRGRRSGRRRAPAFLMGSAMTGDERRTKARRSIDRLVHLELHTHDLSGASTFYRELLGWRTERLECRWRARITGSRSAARSMAGSSSALAGGRSGCHMSRSRRSRR